MQTIEQYLVKPFRDAGAKRALVIGHGEHGKGTVAKALADAIGEDNIATSEHVAHLVYDAVRRQGAYASLLECYQDRVNNRDFWAGFLALYCRHDKARIVRDIYEMGYAVTDGVRRPDELMAAITEGLVDVIYWVDAGPRKPPEPSMAIDFMELMADPRRTVPLVYLDNSEEGDDLSKLRLVGVYDAN